MKMAEISATSPTTKIRTANNTFPKVPVIWNQQENQSNTEAENIILMIL